MIKGQKKLCHRVLSFIDKTPWAIKPDALEKIISIASRSYSDPELVAAIKAEQSLQVVNVNESNDVAIIDVIGPIFTRADFFTDVSGAVSLDSLEQQLDAVLYDDSIKAIVLRVDSPGGEVTGTHEFAHYLDEACEIKPIVAYVTGMACSAAYWLASASSHIYVDKTATLGSVGVVATWTDDSKARSNAGLVDYEVVSSQSPKKRLDPTSDDGKAELQKQIDGLADIFIDDVVSFRDVSRDKVLADFGQGGTFLADEAISIGMADEVSSLREVISLLSSNNQSKTMGASNIMGVKSQRDRKNFALKKNGTLSANRSAKGRRAEDDNDINDLDQQGAEDIEDDKNSGADNDEDNLDAEDDDNQDPNATDDEDNLDAEDDEEHEPAAEDDDFTDEEEEPKAKRAINALARKRPNLYQAIIKRGARRERQRIASIDDLNVMGHEKLITSAKYLKPKTAADTSLAVLQAEQKIRRRTGEDYQSDASFKVPTSSSAGNATKGTSQSADVKSFLANVIAGAKAAGGVK